VFESGGLEPVGINIIDDEQFGAPTALGFGVNPGCFKP
jgi:hypothetical protein